MPTCLQDVGSVEVVEGLHNASLHGLLTLANPDSGVVLLLVGLVGTLGVAHLGLEVVDVLGDVVPDTAEVSPLEVSVEVDLDDTKGDGGAELLDGGAGATVENEEDYGAEISKDFWCCAQRLNAVAPEHTYQACCPWSPAS